MTASEAANIPFDPVFDRKARLWRLADFCAGLVLAPLALAAAIRLVGGESTVEAIALRAATAWIYLPAWLVLGFALARRRPGLIAVSLALVAFHAYWLAPSLRLADAPPHPADVARRFRVMSANVLGVNDDTGGIFEEIERESPDLLLVQEVTPPWEGALSTSALRARFPERAIVARDDSFGIAVLSRFPLTVEALDFDDLPAQLIQVRVGERVLHVLHAHTLPPRRVSMVETWHRMLDAIEELIRKTPGPLILAGDLNTTQFSERYARLEKLGLRGVHETLGRGLATTWPNGRFLFPPIRLDHLLVTSDVLAFDIHEGIGRGSDHRPVIADLGFATNHS